MSKANTSIVIKTVEEKKEKLNEELAKNVKKAMEAQGTTGKALAHVLGISESALSRRLSKLNEFTAVELVLISRYFCYPTLYFFNNEKWKEQIKK